MNVILLISMLVGSSLAYSVQVKLPGRSYPGYVDTDDVLEQGLNKVLGRKYYVDVDDNDFDRSSYRVKLYANGESTQQLKIKLDRALSNLGFHGAVVQYIKPGFFASYRENFSVKLNPANMKSVFTATAATLFNTGHLYSIENENSFEDDWDDWFY